MGGQARGEKGLPGLGTGRGKNRKGERFLCMVRSANGGLENFIFPTYIHTRSVGLVLVLVLGGAAPVRVSFIH